MTNGSDKPDQAARLETARLARGFDSPAAACRFFGWNYDTYIQHERGERGLTRAAKRYAEGLRVSEAWLLTGEGRPPKGMEPEAQISVDELLDEYRATTPQRRVARGIVESMLVNWRADPQG